VRPSLVPGMYFRVMPIGFFEGIESERGIEWRVADSLCREFLLFGLDERTPAPTDGRGYASGSLVGAATRGAQVC
jgi:hypothetical protein